jgi:hypothetical protein
MEVSTSGGSSVLVVAKSVEVELEHAPNRPEARRTSEIMQIYFFMSGG